MNNTGGIRVHSFKLYYRAIAIKTSWCRQKNRYEDQWNRIEDLDMNPHNYTHLIFDKGAKTLNGQKVAYSTNVTGKSGYLLKNTETRSMFITLYRNQVKMDYGP
jgi:hypothetical protein